MNSLAITIAATVVGVTATALGAYALVRHPKLPGFAFLGYGFLVTIRYPFMLLVIPVYLVMFEIGLLGTYAGIVLFLVLGPIQFFLFEQFFRAIPREVGEAAVCDGAGEAQILFRIVLPMAAAIHGQLESSPSPSHAVGRSSRGERGRTWRGRGIPSRSPYSAEAIW